MRIALNQAHNALEFDEIPVGAAGVVDNKIISQSHNTVILDLNPTGHAEINVLKTSARILKNYRLNSLILYTTLEPCLMCYSAMVHARISKLYYGASDPKGGIFSTGCFDRVKSVFNHIIVVESGILEKECSEILKSFFKARRDAGAAERGGLENR